MISDRAREDYLRATGDCVRCHGKGGSPIVDKDTGQRTGRCTCHGKQICEACGKWRASAGIYAASIGGKTTSRVMCQSCHIQEQEERDRLRHKPKCDSCGKRVSEVRTINMSLKPLKPNPKKFCAVCYQKLHDSLVQSLTPPSKKGILKKNNGYQYTLINLDEYKTRPEH